MVTKPQYGKGYQAKRRRLLEAEPWCRYCGDPATVADHVPPVALHQHVNSDGADCCILVPSCQRCSDRQGAGVSEVASRLRRTATAEHEASLAGMGADDPCWQVPWLRRGLLDLVPLDSTWPRFMSAPHPDAVGSLGPEVVASAAEHDVERVLVGRRP